MDFLVLIVVMKLLTFSFSDEADKENKINREEVKAKIFLKNELKGFGFILKKGLKRGEMFV